MGCLKHYNILSHLDFNLNAKFTKPNITSCHIWLYIWECGCTNKMGYDKCIKVITSFSSMTCFHVRLQWIVRQTKLPAQHRKCGLRCKIAHTATGKCISAQLSKPTKFGLLICIPRKAQFLCRKIGNDFSSKIWIVVFSEHPIFTRPSSPTSARLIWHLA